MEPHRRTHASTDGLIKSVSVLLSGSVLAQLIGILSLPFLARIYDPEAFGVLGVFMAFAGILATLVTGRYNLSVMLAETDAESKHSIYLCLWITLGFTCLVAIVSFAGEVVSTLVNAPQLSIYLPLLPFIVALLGLQQTFEVWSSRQKQFALISAAALAGAIIGNACKLWWPVDSSSENGHAWGLIAGSVAAVFATVVTLIVSNADMFKAKAPFSAIRNAANKHSDLPKYRAPKDFLNSLSQNLPAVFLASFFSAGVAGLFVLAEKIMRLPIVFVGGAIRKVLFQHMSESKRSEGECSQFIWKSTFYMAILASVPFIVIAIWGAPIFELVFGQEWFDSGEFARWLALWCFFAFINIPVMVSVPIFNLERETFAFEIVSMLVRLLSIVGAAIVSGDALTTIAVYCIASALTNLVLIIYVYGCVTRAENV